MGVKKKVQNYFDCVVGDLIDEE